MSRARRPVSQLVGCVEDIQLPPGTAKRRTGPGAVSLRVRLDEDGQSTYEWLPVASVLRARVHALAELDGVLIGATFTFDMNADGYIVGFAPASAASSRHEGEATLQPGRGRTADEARREETARDIADRHAGIQAAREMISDVRLSAFLSAANAVAGHGVLPLTMLYDALAAGESLDEILYTDTPSGFLLAATELIGENRFHIGVGFDAGPLAAGMWGWQVTFDGPRVSELRGGDMMWVS